MPSESITLRELAVAMSSQTGNVKRELTEIRDILREINDLSRPNLPHPPPPGGPGGPAPPILEEIKKVVDDTYIYSKLTAAGAIYMRDEVGPAVGRVDVKTDLILSKMSGIASVFTIMSGRNVTTAEIQETMKMITGGEQKVLDWSSTASEYELGEVKRMTGLKIDPKQDVEGARNAVRDYIKYMMEFLRGQTEAMKDVPGASALHTQVREVVERLVNDAAGHGMVNALDALVRRMVKENPFLTTLVGAGPTIGEHGEREAPVLPPEVGRIRKQYRGKSPGALVRGAKSLTTDILLREAGDIPEEGREFFEVDEELIRQGEALGIEFEPSHTEMTREHSLRNARKLGLLAGRMFLEGKQKFRGQIWWTSARQWEEQRFMEDFRTGVLAKEAWEEMKKIYTPESLKEMFGEDEEDKQAAEFERRFSIDVRKTSSEAAEKYRRTGSWGQKEIGSVVAATMAVTSAAVAAEAVTRPEVREEQLERILTLLGEIKLAFEKGNIGQTELARAADNLNRAADELRSADLADMKKNIENTRDLLVGMGVTP